ncbi:hypothetical protein OMCYN_00717 [cyanobiont of Ornithocercus magnificus]|nr:hypothetical protein OMCYN_00717 [cyanobiont of Ornithocercus magnificus]
MSSKISSSSASTESKSKDPNVEGQLSSPVSSCGSGHFIEGGHQLEKLEFALAVACSNGDRQRSQILSEQIAALGGNNEEPGT